MWRIAAGEPTIMKVLIIFLAIVYSSAQINTACTTNTTCQNKASPCTGTRCLCDPYTLTCKLQLGESCTSSQNYCKTGTVCSGSACLALDGFDCDDRLCVSGGNCVLGKCRAMPGNAWNPVTQMYSPCDSSCDTCFSPNNSLACLTCSDPNKVAIGGACVCIEGAADSYDVCSPCDSSCQTCAVPGTPFGCTACASDVMNLISGVCFCPVGTAWNEGTQECESCHSSCATCSIPDNAAYCTSCVVGSLINGHCVNGNGGTTTECSPGTALSGNGICEACHYTCRTCLVPENSNRCTSCTKDKRLVGGMCVPYKIKYKKYQRPPACCPSLMASINGVCKCIRGYVGNSLTPTSSDTYCLPCDSSCLTCYEAENPEACTSCYKGMYLIDGKCSLSPSPKPTPSINCSSVCKTCTVANDPYQCTTCAMTNALQRNGKCYCPPGNYNFTNVCVAPCDYPCSECYINDSSICTACPSYLLPLGGTCVCPNGTALASEGDCASCDVSCLTCGEPDNPLACSSCSDPRAILVNGQCICPDPAMIYNISGYCECPEGQNEVDGYCFYTLCPPGTFLDGDTCVDCPISNCADCDSLTTCVECNPGYYLLGGRCVKCPSNCLTCSSANICTTCQLGYTLVNGKCIQSCPACCSSCTYDSYNNPICTSCLSNFVYINNQCSACSVGIPNCANCRNCGCTKCESGYYLYGSTQCIQCSLAIPDCEICNGVSSCLKCKDG